MILGICDNAELLDTIRIVRTVIKIICLVVPSILLVSLAWTYASRIVKKTLDEITKDLLKETIKKIVAAILIFLVPTFVSLIMRLVVGEEEYKTCLDNATTEIVASMKYDKLDDLISRAETTFSKDDYSAALQYYQSYKEGEEKREFEKRLIEVKKIMDVKDLVAAAKTLPTRDKYKKAKEAVEALPDGEIKEDLLDELKEIAKLLGASDYNPDDPKYKGLKTLSGLSITELLSRNGVSIQEFQSELVSSVESMGVCTRDAVVTAGMYIIDKLADYGYKMNYYWGGKYSIGINPNWGSYIGSSPYCDSHNDPDYCRKTSIYSGFDCSGFVAWSLRQGCLDSSIEQQQTTTGGGIPLAGKTEAVCEPGDALASESHIVLVIGLDDENKRYIIAESSNGLVINTKPYNDSGYYCKKLDFIYAAHGN